MPGSPAMGIGGFYSDQNGSQVFMIASGTPPSVGSEFELYEAMSGETITYIVDKVVQHGYIVGGDQRSAVLSYKVTMHRK